MLRKNFSHTLPVVVTAVLLAAGCLFSCKKKDDTAGTAQFIGEWRGSGCDDYSAKWTEKAPMFSLGRSRAVAFAINSEIYVAGGQNKKDFWQYTPSNNLWTQLPDVPGTSFWRNGAIGFTAKGFGFVGLGMDGGNVYKQDLWKFDPSTNVWTAVSPFPGFPRAGAFCFVVGDTAFVGGGVDSTGARLGDLFAYIVSTDTWITRAYQATTGVAYCSAFAYQHDGYITCGWQNDTNNNNTYKYNPRSDTWTKVADFPGSARYGTSAFVIGSKAYCGSGLAGNQPQQDMYIYDMSNNTWSRMEAYPGGARFLAVATALNSKGYMGTGADLASHYTQWWEYTPKSTNSLIYSVTKGGDDHSIILKYTVGRDTCANQISLTGTVSNTSASGGISKDAFIMNAQTFVDRCGNNYTISGSGQLMPGDSIYITTLSSSKEGTTACTFKGTK